MINEADVDFLYRTATELSLHGMAERLMGLKKLWTTEGLPVKEVDIHYENDEGKTQIHTYNLGSNELDEGYDIIDLRANLHGY